MSWESKTLGDQASLFKEQIVNQLKSDLGDLWDQLNNEDRNQLEYCARRMGELSVRKFAGEDVDEDIRFVKASISNLTCSQRIVVEQKFWTTFHKVVGLAGTFLGKLAKTFIPGGALLG